MRILGEVSVRGITCRVSARRWDGDGFDVRSVVAKDVKSCTNYAAMT